jgi:hypothetical protein
MKKNKVPVQRRGETIQSYEKKSFQYPGMKRERNAALSAVAILEVYLKIVIVQPRGNKQRNHSPREKQWDKSKSQRTFEDIGEHD